MVFSDSGNSLKGAATGAKSGTADAILCRIGFLRALAAGPENAPPAALGNR